MEKMERELQMLREKVKSSETSQTSSSCTPLRASRSIKGKAAGQSLVNSDVSNKQTVCDVMHVVLYDP